MRRIRLILLASLWARALAAQTPDTTGQTPDTTGPVAEEPDTAEPAASWRLSYFPFLSGGVNDGPVFSARVRFWRPADYEARSTADAALTAGAGYSFRGSRYIGVEFRAPQLRKDWRFFGIAGAERLVRFGYFGLGNNTVYDKDLVDDSDPFLYRVRRTRYVGVVEVTRRIRGPFQAALQASLEQSRFTSLPGPSTFANDVPSGELEQDDGGVRLALIYDTRDNEYNTHQGLLLEGGAQVGNGGGKSYSRLYAVLRGYLTPREGTVVAARVAGSGMGGTPTLNSRYDLPIWEGHLPVFGGPYSHRSLDTGRFAGKGTLFFNLEVRHDLISLGDLGAVTLLGFMDAGRVFEEEDFRLTTKDMKVGGGGGIGLRILRSTIFAINLAGGPDGFNYSVGSGWMF
jgi:outer membrane protein assembly factor BamA